MKAGNQGVRKDDITVFGPADRDSILGQRCFLKQFVLLEYFDVKHIDLTNSRARALLKRHGFPAGIHRYNFTGSCPDGASGIISLKTMEFFEDP
jgi:hypothetical protein